MKFNNLFCELIPNYGELEEIADLYYKELQYIEENCDICDYPEDIDSIPEWIIKILSQNFVISIMEELADLSDDIYEYLYDLDYNNMKLLSFSHCNAIFIDINAIISYLDQLASELNLDINYKDYNRFELVNTLNTECSLKFVV